MSKEVKENPLEKIVAIQEQNGLLYFAKRNEKRNEMRNETKRNETEYFKAHFTLRNETRNEMKRNEMRNEILNKRIFRRNPELSLVWCRRQG